MNPDNNSYQPEQPRNNTRTVDRRTVLAGTGAIAVGGVFGGLTGTALASEGEHVPLGSARLQSGSGSVAATNIGTSGGDGLASHTDGASRWDGNLGSTVAEMPIGSSLTVEAGGTVEGESGHQIGWTQLTRTEDSYTLEGGFNEAIMPDDTGTGVGVGDHDDGVGYMIYKPIEGVHTFPPIDIEPDPNEWADLINRWILWGNEITPLGILASEGTSVDFGFDTPIEVSLGDETATGDLVRIEAGNEDGGLEINSIDQLRITGAGLDPIVLADEHVE